MNGRRRSEMWHYYTEVSSSRARCNICKRVLSVHGGTSNLRRHILSSHPTVELAPTKLELDFEDPGSPLDNPLAICTTGTFEAPNITTASQASLKLPMLIDDDISRPMNSLRKSQLDETLVKMISKDCQPLNIVRDNGFVEFLKVLDPSFSLPSIKTLSNSLLPNLYERIRTDVLEKINNATSVCLTTDCWTSLATTRYMSVTCHFVQDYKRASYLLDSFAFTESHTSAQLAQEIDKIANEWGVFDKVVAIVTDDASDIVAGAIRDHLCWDHIPCFAHTLNLIVSASLREVQNVVNNVKTLVEFFEGSPAASDELKSTQIKMDQEPLCLKRADVTRWNSIYFMLKRLIQLKDPVISTLDLFESTLFTLSSEDLEIAQEIVDILKPFEEISLELSSERFLAASKVILMVRGLKQIVTRYQSKPSTHECVQKMVGILMSEINERLGNIEQIEKLADASCLDPRFKKHAFVSNKESEDAIQRIMSSLAQNSSMDDIKEEITEPSTNTGSMFWEDFDERVARASASASNASTAAMMEMRSYLDEPLLPRTSNPLLWWRMSSSVYKLLSEFMKKRLCIVGTSVPSERIFSEKGQIMMERRQRIRPSNVRQIVFLNANLP